jgi:tRNA threonylcarbamoyladenosine biosynthesis protein TsaB
MRILGIDAALACCSVAVLDGEAVLAHRSVPGDRGHSAVLAGMVAETLSESGLSASQLDAVAVTVGPGSFTGLRAALSLGHGLALAAGIPVIGVTVAEALEQDVTGLDGRALWVAIDSRRGRVFLHRDGVLAAVSITALPQVEGRIAVSGDAAIDVASRLLARGADVKLTDLRLPDAAGVARVGARRLAGALPSLAAMPIYVDEPEAKLPAGGLRAAPREA